MSVIELSKFRKSATYEQKRKHEDRYFCKGCNSEHFRLWPDGSVSCTGCGSQMSNLHVHFEP